MRGARSAHQRDRPGHGREPEKERQRQAHAALHKAPEKRGEHGRKITFCSAEQQPAEQAVGQQIPARRQTARRAGRKACKQQPWQRVQQRAGDAQRGNQRAVTLAVPDKRRIRKIGGCTAQQRVRIEKPGGQPCGEPHPVWSAVLYAQRRDDPKQEHAGHCLRHIAQQRRPVSAQPAGQFCR